MLEGFVALEYWSLSWLIKVWSNVWVVVQPWNKDTGFKKIILKEKNLHLDV
jgi:hypothetical protein